MQNFAIKTDIKLSQEFGEKWISSAPTCTQFASLLFLMIYILRINFCVVSSTRNQDLLVPKLPEKVLLQRYSLRDFHQKLIDINLC